MTVILVLLTILLFLLVDQAIQRSRFVQERMSIAGEWLGAVPPKVALSVNHMWMRHERNGLVTLGLDPLLTSLLGPTAHIVAPESGSIVTDEQSDVKLKLNNGTMCLASPVSGYVVETNERLQTTPSLLWKSPFGAGWLMKVRPIQDRDRSGMFVARHGVEWLRDQAAAIREFIAHRGRSAVLTTLQDGGFPVEGVLGFLDSASLEEFTNLFVTLPIEAESHGEENHAAPVRSSR